MSERILTMSAWDVLANLTMAALAASFTAVLIADVLETIPEKAEESARDAVKLKGVRTLPGQPPPVRSSQQATGPAGSRSNGDSGKRSEGYFPSFAV